MIHSSFFRSTPLWLVLAATAAASASEVPTDPFGRPLFDSASNPLFYQPGSEPKESLSPAAAPEPVSGMALIPSWDIPASPGGAPFWGSGVFGAQIGLAGWVTSPGANGLNIIVSATTPASFGPNSFWYVLNYDPVTKRYYQVHTQAPYSPLPGQYPFGEMAGMMSAQLVGGAEPELVVGMTDGRFFFYSLNNFREVRRIRPVTGLTDFTTADLTGDGVAELLVLTESGLEVFNASGVLQWSVTGPAGEDLVAAQMDEDPALEIATTSGHVVDAGSRKVQWIHGEGFGLNLRAADIDGDSRAELIAAEDWYYIHAYDVDERLLKWSFRTELDISTLEIANVDGDPAPELLYGDNQWGSVHVLTLGETTPVRKWKVGAPDPGIPRIAAIDADQDGVTELIWSGGANSTGEDRLNVFDPVTQDTEWQSIHLDGPFLSPVMGDVTGDGKPEMVTVSQESESGYSSGCILVFDPETLALLAISQPIADGLAIEGVRKLVLRDIDGDARQEIVVAADSSRRGLADIYKFTDAGTFELEWRFLDFNGDPFTQVEVADVDGDGNLEVVTTSAPVHSPERGYHLQVIDLATKTVEWKISLNGPSNGADSLAVADVDEDGNLEAVVGMGNLGLQVLDLKERIREPWFGGACEAIAVRPGVPGFIAGHWGGMIAHYTSDGAGGYAAADSWRASNGTISGLTIGSGQSLWVTTGQRISLWTDKTAPVWSTGYLGSSTVGTVAIHEGPDGTEVYAGLDHGLAGFKVGGSPDFATVQMESAGSLAEGSAGELTLAFSRDTPDAADMAVIFSLTGAAAANEDYNVTGAFSLGDGLWSVLIPAGQTSVTAVLSVIQDSLSEGPESLLIGLEPSTDYFLGSSASVGSSIQDDEPFVRVTTGDATASELKSGRLTDNASFILHRSGGNLSRPLVVRIGLGGTATLGSDYRKIGSSVTFPKNKDTVEVKVIPILDRRAEQTEAVRLEIAPDPRYAVSPSESEASVTILDAEPTVSLTGTSSVEGGVAVNLTRSGGHSLPIAVTLKLLFEEGGVVRTSQRKLSFKAGAESAQYLVKPSPRASGAAQVTVEVLDTGAFHRGAGTSATFTLPGR